MCIRDSARIVGETMGNYHPHGDQAIYPTLVHMAQPWAMRERLVEGKGNFGSVEDDPPASMRYTEARLTHLGAALTLPCSVALKTYPVIVDGDDVRPLDLQIPARVTEASFAYAKKTRTLWTTQMQVEADIWLATLGTP